MRIPTRPVTAFCLRVPRELADAKLFDSENASSSSCAECISDKTGTSRCFDEGEAANATRCVKKINEANAKATSKMENIMPPLGPWLQSTHAPAHLSGGCTK